MTRTDLLQTIALGENSGVEFKRDTIDARQLAKELVAFANFRGGVVLLGVDDDGSVAGLTRQKIEEWVITVCRDKIRPEIIPYFAIIPGVEPGKDVAVVQVEPDRAVHHVWHDNHRTYYIRVGTQSREASPEELAALFQRRGNIRFDLQPVPRTSFEDLDLRRLRDYFEVVRGQRAPDTNDRAAWVRLLLNIEVLTEGDGVTPVTTGGMLLFGRNPKRFLPQSGIDAVAYPGKEKDYDTLERLFIRGPMVRLGPRSDIVENGTVESAIQFLQRHVSRESVDGLGIRARVWDYPEEVLREGLVNAVIHRDYLLSGTTIDLCVYSDRLEIVSPGRPPNGITPERMRAGCRAARNELLKETMRDYGYLESSGLGISRKIIPGMLAHNGTEPDLIANPDDEQFVLRLWKHAR